MRLSTAGYAAALLGLAAISALSVLASLALGAVDVPLAAAFGALFDPAASDPVVVEIVRQLRLPRAALGWCVGAALAMAGAALQAVMRSELADPYVLGVSSGASVGAALAVVLGAEHLLGGAQLMGLSYLAAIGGVVCVLAVARVGGRVDATRLLLAGAAFSAFAGSLTGLLLFLVPEASALRGLVFWLLGGLGAADGPLLAWTAASTLLGGVGLLALARWLNLLLLGDEAALALGLEVGRARAIVVLLAALMVGATVASAGVIGFVGLVVPHVARPFAGPDHRRLLPMAALGGGVLVVWMDLLARLLLAPREIPVGVLTGLIGAPVFLARLRRAIGASDG